MSAFTGDLTITQTADWRVWILQSPLVYELGDLGSGKVIAIAAGFVTDGTSIPRILWWALPTWGNYSRAAVVHDYLYDRMNARDPHPLAPDRKAADGIFLEAMGVCGVSWPVRYGLWVAVRILGGIGFFKRLVIAD